MIDDLLKLPEGVQISTDICIVGAGPAGIALAMEFMDSKTSVLLLESGGMNLEEATQELTAHENVGTISLREKEARARAFGGTSKLWAGQCVRLDALDLEKRPWVPFSGWPVTPGDLEGYYRRAEEFFDIKDEIYDDGIYDRFRVREPFDSLSDLESRFTIFISAVDLGVKVRSKLESTTNIRVILHGNVSELETNEAGTQIRSVRIQSLDGKQGRVSAKVFVLCTGGIENARLLLLPTKYNSRGLGNERDLVGKFFQEHPTGVTATMSGQKCGPALEDQFRLFYRAGKRYFPRFALSADYQREHETLNCNAHLVVNYGSESAIGSLQHIYQSLRKGRLSKELLQSCVRLASGLGDVGGALRRRFIEGKSPKGPIDTVSLQCWSEQAPNETSRVFLSNETDPLGLPKVVVDWRLGGLEKRTIQSLTTLARSEFLRLGLGEWVIPEWLADPGAWGTIHDGAHHIGTTRIATSPEFGVVDTDCKVFGVDGLYVAGSSVFPTSGWANPTLTIVALALRLADHLKRNRLSTE